MEQFIKISLIIHVIAGTGALIFGALSIYFKKNTPKHRPMGKYYFYSMTVIFITGVYLSIIRYNLFLFFISFFTYYACIVAYRAIKLKNNSPKTIDKLVDIIALLTNLSLIVFAVYTLIKLQKIDALVPLAFGSLGMLGVKANYKKYYTLYNKKDNQWLQTHVGNMMGSYIGAITAFTVNQAWKLEVPNIVAWLGPTIILTPIIIMELRKLKNINLGSLQNKTSTLAN